MELEIAVPSRWQFVRGKVIDMLKEMEVQGEKDRVRDQNLESWLMSNIYIYNTYIYIYNYIHIIYIYISHN